MRYLPLAIFLLSCSPQPTMPKNCRFSGVDQSWVCTGTRYDFTFLPHPEGVGRPAGRVLQSVDGQLLPLVVDSKALPMCVASTTSEAP